MTGFFDCTGHLFLFERTDRDCIYFYGTIFYYGSLRLVWIWMVFDFTEAGHTRSFSFGLVGPYISNCQQSLFEREREVCDKHNQLCVLCFVCVRVYFYSIVEEGIDLREGCVLSVGKVRRQEETNCNCKVIKLH